MRRDSLVRNRSLSHQLDEFVKRYLKIGPGNEVIVLDDVPAIGQADVTSSASPVIQTVMSPIHAEDSKAPVTTGLP